MGSGYPKGGGPGKVTAGEPGKMAPKRNRGAPHPGVTVSRSKIGRCFCDGAGKDEAEKAVDGYTISDLPFDAEFRLCRPCAMKLALRIFELENL